MIDPVQISLEKISQDQTKLSFLMTEVIVVVQLLEQFSFIIDTGTKSLFMLQNIVLLLLFTAHFSGIVIALCSIRQNVVFSVFY